MSRLGLSPDWYALILMNIVITVGGRHIRFFIHIIIVRWDVWLWLLRSLGLRGRSVY